MNRVRLFILFGAPGSGKSTSCLVLNEIMKGKLKVLQKETTRPSRSSDDQEIKSVEEISSQCDFRYSQYGYEYGFSSQMIWEDLRNGNSVVVIVNDVRTIKILNKKFGNLAQNIYIHSNIDKEKITKVATQRYPDADHDFLERDISRRIEKIKTIHRKYIENTYLFHSAIINIYKEGDDESMAKLRYQLEQLHNKVGVHKSFFGSTARIIVIAGASFSGKDALVNAMIQMEPDKTLLYQKGTTRPRKDDDKGELLHLDKLSRNYDIRYDKNGYIYGLSTKDIWKNLAKQKIVLIILSDLSSILKLKEEFTEICTVVYLHASIDEGEMEKAKEEMSEAEFAKRINSVKELRETYIKHTNVFNHVLLNTSESEDLYDQAFNILDFYLE